MKLLKQINERTTEKQINEDAAGGAVGAGAVASCAMPLFSTLVARSAPKVKTIKWATSKKATTPKKKTLGLKEAFSALTEFSQGGDTGGMSMNMDGTPIAKSTSSFDSAAVISKLKSLEDKSKQEQGNTASFGLEDEHGGIVRVTVNGEQAEEFEKALQAFLAREEQDGEKIPEIAEVLFKLKDQFDILNVVWPEVQEDEEEDVALSGDDQQGGTNANDLDLGDGSEQQQDQGQNDLDSMGSGAASDGDVQSLLTQVIDMMKADADARKAEANAKEAEAKAREADMIVKQTMSKVKQEEQFLDMEQYDKARKDEEREVKRLAKLARWKHEMGRDEEDDTSSEPPESNDLDTMLGGATKRQAGSEEEERVRRPSPTVAQPGKAPAKVIRGRVHPHDIASFILSRVK